MRKQVELAAGLLNLKAHYVGRPSNQKLLYLAGDVEGTFFFWNTVSSFGI